MHLLFSNEKYCSKIESRQEHEELYVKQVSYIYIWYLSLVTPGTTTLRHIYTTLKGCTCSDVFTEYLPTRMLTSSRGSYHKIVDLRKFRKYSLTPTYYQQDDYFHNTFIGLLVVGRRGRRLDYNYPDHQVCDNSPSIHKQIKIKTASSSQDKNSLHMVGLLL